MINIKIINKQDVKLANVYFDCRVTRFIIHTQANCTYKNLTSTNLVSSAFVDRLTISSILPDWFS